MRILLLISMFYYLYGVENFKEIRYIDALESTQVKYGSMSMLDGVLILSYTQPSTQTLSYEDTKLLVQSDGELNEYSFQDYPKLQYMGLLLKAIVKEDYTLIEDFFDVKIENDSTLLIPKEDMLRVIKSIKITRDNDTLQSISMYMANEDKIDIQTID